MDRTLKCDHSLESFTVMLIAFQFYPGYHFGKIFSYYFGLGTVRSARVKTEENYCFDVFIILTL